MLGDLRVEELYYLLSAAIEYGRGFARGPLESFDLPRMVTGFNFGKLAGQTIPHFHGQYGWEVVIDGEAITKEHLSLYYSELRKEHLILYEDDRIKVIAPWTPKGQFHIDLHFNKVYEIHRMDEPDVKLFASLGHSIVQHCVGNLTIQNINVVLLNSPLQRQIIPVIAQFVPRVNMPALYEVKGVNVVDTFPQDIAMTFRGIKWDEEVSKGLVYDPTPGWLKIISPSPPPPSPGVTPPS